MSRQWGFTLNIIEVSDEPFKDLPVWLGNRATYFRILVDRLIPQSVDKVLYLDCDVIVMDSLAPLYETDLSGKYAAVVKEGTVHAHLPFEHPYFNAGMVLFNLKQYREDGVAEKAIQYGHKHLNKLRFNDQDMFNLAFQGQVVYVPYKWNLLEFHGSTQELPLGIVHFNVRKPWRVGCVHMHKKVYWKYLVQTPYYKQVRQEYYQTFLEPKRALKAFRRWVFRCRFSRHRFYVCLFGIRLCDWNHVTEPEANLPPQGTG